MNWSRPRSTLAHARVLAAARGSERIAVEALHVDADRERADAQLAAECGNGVAARGAAVGPAHVLLEAREVLGCLESDEVVGEERLHQRLVLGQRREDLRRRERRVQEEADALAHAQAAQLVGERNQVEVVRPDDVVAAQQLCKCRGEARVDAP